MIFQPKYGGGAIDRKVRGFNKTKNVFSHLETLGPLTAHFQPLWLNAPHMLLYWNKERREKVKYSEFLQSFSSNCQQI